MWFLFLPLMFLTTLFAPKEALSGWLEAAATVDPTTYVLAGMRSLSMSGWDASDLGGAVLAVAAMGTISVSLALLALNRPSSMETWFIESRPLPGQSHGTGWLRTRRAARSRSH